MLLLRLLRHGTILDMSALPPSSTPSEPRAAALPRGVQWLLRGLAVLSLALGFLGLFLPVLPTTPFILLAAWAAARSSPKLLMWLESHRLFGQMLRDWRQGGVVSRKVKWGATIVMSISALFLLLTVFKLWAVVFAIACMSSVLIWLWCRPEG